MAASASTAVKRISNAPMREQNAADTLVRAALSSSLADGGVLTAEILRNALLIDPHHHQARLLLENLHRQQAPRWHFPMLGDKVRNAAYRRAIEAKVRPGDIVLDIGCGAGLTAMLAARAGAAHVYACEGQPMIAATAAEIIKANGLSDKITILPKWSKDLQVGVDLPEPADVVVSEIVDCTLLGEGALPTLEHAMAHLAKPGARAVPEQGALSAQPIECEALFSLWRPGEVEGFDLSPFHRFASISELTPGEFNAMDARGLGPALPLFAFDFAAPHAPAARMERALPCESEGMLHAVAAQFELKLAPGVSISNDLHSTGHWGRRAFLLDAPRAVTAGDAVDIIAEHDRSSLTISVR